MQAITRRRRISWRSFVIRGGLSNARLFRTYRGMGRWTYWETV
jgi:hypothetical protein